MDYGDYKKRRKNAANVLASIKEANEEKKTDFTDSRFYQYVKDKTGNAFSVIRFLPSKNETLPPVVSRYSHGFKQNGGWYIEQCPTTIKQKCPVCESNSDLWNTNTKENQDIVRGRSRRKEFFANVYIVKDAQHPEKEGKVFIWKFGQKVYTKIMEKLQPQFEDEKPIDIFDLEEGANFKLKIKTVAGFSNYDGSEFMEKAPLFTDEKQMSEIFNQIYDLKEFIDEKNFKPYEKLKERFEKISSSKGKSKPSEESTNEEPKNTPATNITEDVDVDDGDEDDGDEDYFKDLTKKF